MVEYKPDRFIQEEKLISWKERTLIQKLIFWRKFKITYMYRVRPDNPLYEEAPYEEYIYYGRDPFPIKVQK